MTRLKIEVTFLAGRYGGEEWPPAPMRLLQALVGGYRDTHPALFVLETLPAPTLLAEDDPPSTTVKTYVPLNTRKGTDATPFERAEQVRTIRRPSRPVVYCWEIDAAPITALSPIIEISAQLHTLGTGQDMCAARAWFDEDALTSVPGQSLWTPLNLPGSVQLLNSDTDLRIPVIGSVASIAKRHARSQRHCHSPDAFTSFLRLDATYAIQRYSLAGRNTHYLMMPIKLLHPDQEEQPLSWAPELTVQVSAMLRHGVMQLMQDTPYAAWAAGHSPPDDKGARLSWIPLPSIGHAHADRRIRQALLVARVSEQEEMEALYQRLLTEALPLRDERSACCVARARVVQSRQDRRANGVLWAYRRKGYTYQTVTPIALPGCFATDHKQTRKLVRKALRESGLDLGMVEEIEVSRFPYHRYEPQLSAVMLKRWQAHAIPLTYARVHFREPIAGPLIIGRGRHFGLGLMCANPD
ncbi:type I-G CRISPR-associated protein Csb2 [Parachitinimonas caeni]|uniref:Type I-U CRISPR-associated protein Csb2 n=1 Tax=Parachitinimonas caeni TaxID=3031301 RepID=A0ABT7E6D9_9NEIS|nr:type I-U CRISPR-associated protein Csb2 [Parachitinimonas caeni]MDK2126492.1 type I-U CRISPR-associated protein Csb2 [Parachitinimonas caeni]